jgi:anti-sigma B factor antagonist
MPIKIELGAEGSSRAVVDGSMTIYEAAIDKPVLLDAVAKASETVIDLSSVREMDTAGLQLLILAKREALKAGKVLRLWGRSAVCLDVLERYNLASYFGDPVVVSPRGNKKTRRNRSKARSSRP